MTAAARTTGHVISLCLTIVMMGAISGYVYYTASRRWGTHWQKWGPTYLTVLASICVLADQMRHVLQDYDVWPAGQWPGSSEYKSDCHDETFRCLNAVGWIFTVFLTYFGFLLLLIGSFWNANIMDKLDEFRAKWRELREGDSPSASQAE